MLNRVVDGHSSRDAAARRIDVNLDVFLGAFALEKQQLCNDAVGNHIGDGAAQNDNTVFEQTAEDIPSSFTAMCLFNYIREKCHFVIILRIALFEPRSDSARDIQVTARLQFQCRAYVVQFKSRHHGDSSPLHVAD